MRTITISNKHQSAALVAALALSAAPAFAAVDVSGATSAIVEAGVAGGAVGLAVVVMLIGIKVFKWIRTAL
jgi:hypothetical protein